MSWESGGAWISLSLVRRVPLTPSARAHYEAYCKPVPVAAGVWLAIEQSDSSLVDSMEAVWWC